MIGLIVEQAIKTGTGERFRRIAVRSPEPIHPLQPSCVFYLWNHPFTVNRLSANALEGHSTRVISCVKELGKTTS